MCSESSEMDIGSVIGKIPYRLALAGGWIDQPFVSRENPTPPGSMVVVNLQPICRYMDRAGMATSTRSVAARVWGGQLPPGEPQQLVKELYRIENSGKSDPSGSQDMAGLIYPGINRLDYDCSYESGYFPAHVESNTDPSVARWLEDVVFLLPVVQRPDGYNPLEIKNIRPEWVRRLGQSGRDCYGAIITKDLDWLGQSLNECMLCWEELLPLTVSHPAIQVDLAGLLHFYQAKYAGAMFSGCGGGYLIVVSETEVPGGMKIKVRYSQ